MPADGPPELQRLQADGGILLEPLTCAHAAAMFAVLSDPALYRHLDYGPPPSIEHLQGVYQRLERRRSPDGDDAWLNWIVRPGGGAPAGYVQATVVGGSGDAWIGYVLGRQHWGRGIAGRAVDAMLRHVAEAWAARRFLASVEAANAPSIALLERLSFTRADADARAAAGLGASEQLYRRDLA